MNRLAITLASTYRKPARRPTASNPTGRCFKRGIMGTFHHISPKHTDRYTTEFAERHNDRDLDTIDQIHNVINGMNGKHLPYERLIGPPHTRMGLGIERSNRTT